MPFEDKLSGGGEIMISLGLSYGLSQFGGLINFSSLFALLPIFKTLGKNNNFTLIMIIILNPITIFLLSSPKPQIMPAISSLIVFSYTFSYIKSKQSLFIINNILLSILCMNFVIKFSFILSSLLLGLILIYKNLIIKNYKSFLKSLLLVFTFTVLPVFIYRIIYYDVTILNLFLSPLPLNIYGYENFNRLITSDEETKI